MLLTVLFSYSMQYHVIPFSWHHDRVDVEKIAAKCDSRFVLLISPHIGNVSLWVEIPVIFNKRRSRTLLLLFKHSICRNMLYNLVLC